MSISSLCCSGEVSRRLARRPRGKIVDVPKLERSSGIEAFSTSNFRASSLIAFDSAEFGPAVEECLALSLETSEISELTRYAEKRVRWEARTSKGTKTGSVTDMKHVVLLRV